VKEPYYGIFTQLTTVIPSKVATISRGPAAGAAKVHFPQEKKTCGPASSIPKSMQNL